MKVLVTGGAGFVGSTLVERLVDEGHQVDVIDDLSSGSLANLAAARATRSGRLTFHQVDIRDSGVPDLLVRRKPEVVFHLAEHRADSFDGIVNDAHVNIVGALNVLEGARRAGARKVVVGSDGAALYAPAAPSELPIREKHQQHSLSPHGVAKKVLVDYLSLYREVHALEFTVLVLAEVYGPRQRRGLVADLRAQVASGQVACDPARTTDLVHVDDVVDAFVRAADKGSGLVANVGTGVEISIGDLVAAVATSLGCQAPEITPVGGSPRFALDPGRARIHLGWSPWTAMDDGLARLADEG